MTKEKAMYQTWLIVEGLPAEEKAMISKDLLDEIQHSMEVDDSIQINWQIPLEKQKLDSYTWKMLEKILESAKKNGYQEKKTSKGNPVATSSHEEKVEQFRLENIKLTKELQEMKEASFSLITDYKEAFEKVVAENKELKQNLDALIQEYQRTPALVRKLFMKDDNVKRLVSGDKK